VTSSRRPSRFLGACAVLVLIAGGAAVFRLAVEPPPGAARIGATISVTGALGADEVSGFARAAGPRAFSFPRDHGPHPEFRTEWWYYTGNLRARDGRHVGFQLTFFRIALGREPVARASDWGATSRTSP